MMHRRSILSTLVHLGTLGAFVLSTSCTASPRIAAPSIDAVLAQSILTHQYAHLRDEVVERYVAGVIARLTSNPLTRKLGRERGEDLMRPLRLTLVQDPQPVALSLPESDLLLSTGMLRALSNEAQLAFVLAHEIAHAQLGHHQRLTRELDAGDRHDLELSADARAVALVAAAGYDPRAALMALRHTDRGREHSPTHPELAERESALIERIEASGWQPPGIISRRDFTLIQHRLR